MCLFIFLAEDLLACQVTALQSHKPAANFCHYENVFATEQSSKDLEKYPLLVSLMLLSSCVQCKLHNHMTIVKLWRPWWKGRRHDPGYFCGSVAATGLNYSDLLQEGPQIHCGESTDMLQRLFQGTEPMIEHHKHMRITSAYPTQGSSNRQRLLRESHLAWMRPSQSCNELWFPLA